METQSSFTLDNGLRCVHIADRSAVETTGVFVNAGSRDDPEEHPGLAHFVEHTVFKGTTRRSAWHINNRMEAIGGELNAFTAKEETFIYAIGPRGGAARAVELVADLVINSTFPQRETDIERGVVLDEIDTYLDSPADAAFDDFEDALFSGSPLGHNILGTREAVSAFGPQQCRSFVETHYSPTNMVFFYIGPASPGRIEALAARHFGSFSRPYTPRILGNVPHTDPFERTRQIESHQSNTVAGVRIPGRDCPEQSALLLLANMLGGPGMNALLNLQLRERRGLVYSVDASTTFYSDCGMLAIAFGCDPDNRRRCTRLVRSVLGTTLPANLTPRRIEAAKKQFIGQTLLRHDNRDTRVFSTARSLLRKGRLEPIGEFIDSIRSLDEATLRHVAAEWLDPDRFSWLTLL